MHTITIGKPKRFAWLMWLLNIRSIYTMPENWNELSRPQLLVVAKMFFIKDNIHAINLKLIKALTGLPWIIFMPSKLSWWKQDQEQKHFHFLSDDAVLVLTEKIDWVMKGEYSLTNNLIEKYRGLYGPLDHFKNVTVGEFFFADPLFSKYLHDQQPRDLEFLCAILYRKKKSKRELNANDFDGDKRERFNNHTIESRLRNVSKWPAEVKQSILLYYYGCRRELSEKFPKIFSSTESNGGNSTIYPMISGFCGKFGTIKEAMHVKLWDFLIEVNAQIEEAERRTKK